MADDTHNEAANDESDLSGPASAEAMQQEQDSLAEALKEIDKLKDQTLRAMAEAENMRRRMQKEMEDGQKYAVSSFAKEMLAVADNFSRAMEAVPKDEAASPALKNLVTGVEAIERQIAAIFEKFGIRKIESLGQPFDPHLHRVMMEQEDLSKPAGTIIQDFQPGYMIHDRLLREAMVVVSKGGPVAHKVDQSA